MTDPGKPTPLPDALLAVCTTALERDMLADIWLHATPAERQALLDMPDDPDALRLHVDLWMLPHAEDWSNRCLRRHPVEHHDGRVTVWERLDDAAHGLGVFYREVTFLVRDCGEMLEVNVHSLDARTGLLARDYDGRLFEASRGAVVRFTVDERGSATATGWTR